jgi:hypothetical protein
VNNKVWINNRQPQTLYIAQIMLYFSAASALLFGSGGVRIFESALVQALLILLLTLGAGLGAFGIANEKKWGYRLGAAAAIAPFVIRLGFWQRFGLTEALQWDTLGLIFDIAILAALLHRQSAEYQRIYFR